MDNGFKILERLLHIANIRHGIIASNIANVDTPNFKARDIKFNNVLKDETLPVVVTNSKHIGSTDTMISGEIKIEAMNPWLDGNTVELDVEVAKMTENAMLFQAGISLFSKKIKMFKDALRTR